MVSNHREFDESQIYTSYLKLPNFSLLLFGLNRNSSIKALGIDVCLALKLLMHVGDR